MYKQATYAVGELLAAPVLCVKFYVPKTAGDEPRPTPIKYRTQKFANGRPMVAPTGFCVHCASNLNQTGRTALARDVGPYGVEKE